MADKVIAATLKVNTGSSVQDVEAVNKSLAGTTAVLGGTNEQAKTTKGSFDTLKDGLGKLPGPMKAVTSGIDEVTTSLKALAANPIVLVITLIVAALYGLYKAFASTEEGAEKIDQVLSGLGAAMHVVADRVLKLGGAIVDFFKGEFKKSFEDAKAAVTGIGDAVVDAYTKTAEATKLLQKADDDYNRQISTNRAKLDRDLAKSKELITDETASYADRKKAINDVRDAQAIQAAAELQNAKEKLIATVALSNADKANADKRDAAFKAQQDYYAVQQQQAADLRNLNKQDHQIEASENAKNDAASKLSHEAKMKQLADEKALEQELYEVHKKTLELSQGGIVTAADEAKDAADQKAAIQADADKKEQDRFTKQAATMRKLGDGALKKDVDATKLNVQSKISIGQGLLIYQKQALDVTSNLFASAANLAGKNSALGKAFAIAGATIDTYRGALAAFTGMTSSIPGPVGIALGIAAAAAAVANGLATVKQIISVKIPGGADAGAGGAISNPVSNSVAAPVAPTQQGTSIDQNSINGIGNAVSGRSYVLSQDVTHDQDRNERLNRSARLGG